MPFFPHPHQKLLYFWLLDDGLFNLRFLFAFLCWLMILSRSWCSCWPFVVHLLGMSVDVLSPSCLVFLLWFCWVYWVLYTSYILILCQLQFENIFSCCVSYLLIFKCLIQFVYFWFLFICFCTSVVFSEKKLLLLMSCRVSPNFSLVSGQIFSLYTLWVSFYIRLN